jgi:hypothetical protein
MLPTCAGARLTWRGLANVADGEAGISRHGLAGSPPACDLLELHRVGPQCFRLSAVHQRRQWLRWRVPARSCGPGGRAYLAGSADRLYLIGGSASHIPPIETEASLLELWREIGRRVDPEGRAKSALDGMRCSTCFWKLYRSLADPSATDSDFHGLFYTKSAKLA